MEDSSGESAPRGKRGTDFGHVPVLLKEAINFLAVKPGGLYVDATVGLGGHSYEVARRLGRLGRLIGLDKDPAALERASARLAQLDDDAPHIELVHSSFAELASRVEEGSVDGILADLGVSSLQFDDASRGFSFRTEAPLDMRMDPQSGQTAEQVVNQLSERELADLIYEFGEERRSRRIARAICRARPIRSTQHLADVVSAAARPMNLPGGKGTIHPATQTFQALRIYVNRELDDLRELLVSAPRVLKSEGRLVVISFHSLEDRMVKDAMRDGAHAGVYRLLTKKPVVAGEEEVRANPRSRSAKLRAAGKL